MDSERAERMRREKGIPENPVKLVDEFSSTGQGQRTACYDPGPGPQPTDNDVPSQRHDRQLLETNEVVKIEVYQHLEILKHGRRIVNIKTKLIT